jgi:site-specific recombinase XerD
LSREAVNRWLDAVEADYQLPVRPLYGSGLRLRELLWLRGKEVALARRQTTVRETQGQKDRVTRVPTTQIYTRTAKQDSPPLRACLKMVAADVRRRISGGQWAQESAS